MDEVIKVTIEEEIIVGGADIFSWEFPLCKGVILYGQVWRRIFSIYLLGTLAL